MITADQIVPRGVYGVFDSDGILMYIGSSACKLQTLENNHRNWETKNYTRTKFRQSLVSRGQNWRFVWLKKPFDCSAKTIEMVEQDLILLLEPRLNVDKSPVQSSIFYGRYS